MLAGTPSSRSLTIFYILVAYVFLQFSWWAIHIVDLSKQTFLQEEQLNRRLLMIAGEALVFVVLLTLGILKIRSTFKKEVELSRRQKNFLLSVTHELKSPIASIKLNLQTLQRHPQLDLDKKNLLLQKALLEGERLNQMVENMLIATRLEENIPTLSIQNIPLLTFVEQLISQFDHEKKLSTTTKLTIDSALILKADADALRTVLINVYENALKYSPNNTTIEIESALNSASITLIFKDQGTGIAIENREKVLEKFFREGNEETRKTKGTGLGLYIVNKLMALHGGRIAIKSNQPAGTQVELTFPLK
jgi:two-component system, OmpR family, phosphate regulon sensor histidine kinase PhoR